MAKIGILGAGIAGLSVAHLLSDSADSFGAYDQEDAPGGLARSFYWLPAGCAGVMNPMIGANNAPAMLANSAAAA